MSKVALVTGTSTGLGTDIAKTLAKNGINVYASMRGLNGKNSESAQELRNWASENNASLKTIDLDVTDENSIQLAVDQIIADEGRIDVLVNNAGNGGTGFLETYTSDQVRKQYEVNVFGLINTTKAVIPSMRQNRSGLIINISSTISRGAFPMFSLYGSTKYAVEGLTQSWKLELAPVGIDVVSVEPGMYPTTGFFGKMGALSPEWNDSIASEYGALKDMPANFGSMVQGAIESGEYNKPELVGEVVLEQINKPFGERPIRVVADPTMESVFTPLNVAAEQVQNEMNAALGIGEEVAA